MVRADVRLIAATTLKSDRAGRAGQFREDLFYRLNVHPIGIPPLRRQGKPTSAPFARRFCARFAAEESKRAARLQRWRAELCWAAYDWPGNVRQLENAVFRAVGACRRLMSLPSPNFPRSPRWTPGFDVLGSGAPRRAPLDPPSARKPVAVAGNRSRSQRHAAPRRRAAICASSKSLRRRRFDPRLSIIAAACPRWRESSALAVRRSIAR